MGQHATFRRDFSGEIIKLTLKKIKDYRRYSLYQVIKIIKQGDKVQHIPLYKETFTPEQVDAFYNRS